MNKRLSIELSESQAETIQKWPHGMKSIVYRQLTDRVIELANNQGIESLYSATIGGRLQVGLHYET